MTAKARVLVVDDEAAILRFLKPALEANSYEMTSAGTMAEAIKRIAAETPDIVLLDLGLPDGDGIDLTRRIREWGRMPVIVISARGREDDKVAALDAGADDYLTKPFGVNELLARMRVALRHTRAGGTSSGAQTIEVGDLGIDLVRREVKKGGQEVHLTPIEYKLLVLLAQNAGKVLTHQHILKEVWGPAYANQPHYVRVHMAELRKKIEANPARPKLLVTEPGVGYRLRDRAADDAGA